MERSSINLEIASWVHKEHNQPYYGVIVYVVLPVVLKVNWNDKSGGGGLKPIKYFSSTKNTLNFEAKFAIPHKITAVFVFLGIFCLKS